MKPTFFESPAQFRKWLQRHSGGAQELLVGFYKTGSGKPTITWPQSVDEALCFGWIDGVRKRKREAQAASGTWDRDLAFTATSAQCADYLRTAAARSARTLAMSALALARNCSKLLPITTYFPPTASIGTPSIL
jgi:hypothetical protein